MKLKEIALAATLVLATGTMAARAETAKEPAKTGDLAGKAMKDGAAGTPGDGTPSATTSAPDNPQEKKAQQSPTATGDGKGDQGPVSTPKAGTADPKALPGAGPVPKGN